MLIIAGIFKMSGIPRSLAIRSTINIPDITIPTPTTPVVILPLASSSLPLSPPAVITPMAPEIKVNRKNIKARIVIKPMAEEIIRANRDSAPAG